MSTSAVIKAADIVFDKKLSGYSKEQVDSYIGTLTSAYEKAYKEYCGIKKRYDELLREYDLMEKQIERSKLNPDCVRCHGCNVIKCNVCYTCPFLL